MQTKKKKVNKIQNFKITNLEISSDEEIAKKMYINGAKHSQKNIAECGVSIFDSQKQEINSFNEAYNQYKNDSILKLIKRIFNYKIR